MLTTLFVTPLIIFMAIVAPLWLILHYKSKRQVEHGISEQEREQLTVIAARAKEMSARIGALESILDESVPHWRDS
ncbi:envelope stress response membrane protein PspB [Agarivorans sp. MS3-6]|uniref:envelope stress response membrane protein PspB n=1 Tax=Agarivorans sp. TSD2052 TaxID=2937286 RepID=UPI0020105C3B|nr:envelope stress response membrane protein PspB [Agarivorans sp. TSD2052]UPW16942.1 envelope stress response membrane protein PspB [Agarivorans sp. TSD2052]